MTDIIHFSFEHTEAVYTIERESFGVPWSRQIFIELLDNPLAVAFTAIEGNEISGYLISLYISPEIEILNIAVKKSKRRKNIATALFSEILKYAASKKAERLTLEVRPSNSGARAFYKKLGFTIDGTRKNYYANPKEDALLMSLRLN
jgi:ribosomal-protein-alanine N-acetyltransferase